MIGITTVLYTAVAVLKYSAIMMHNRTVLIKSRLATVQWWLQMAILRFYTVVRVIIGDDSERVIDHLIYSLLFSTEWAAGQCSASVLHGWMLESWKQYSVRNNGACRHMLKYLVICPCHCSIHYRRCSANLAFHRWNHYLQYPLTLLQGQVNFAGLLLSSSPWTLWLC